AGRVPARARPRDRRRPRGGARDRRVYARAGGPVKALLLDLDDTLIPDYAGFLAAVDDCAAALGGPSGMGAVLHARARVLWGQAPDAAALEMRDMSSWEALWAPFPVGTEEWADAFRLGAWHQALAEHGVDDRELAERLAKAYREHRHARVAAGADASCRGHQRHRGAPAHEARRVRPDRALRRHRDVGCGGRVEAGSRDLPCR